MNDLLPLSGNPEDSSKVCGARLSTLPPESSNTSFRVQPTALSGKLNKVGICSNTTDEDAGENKTGVCVLDPAYRTFETVADTAGFPPASALY